MPSIKIASIQLRPDARKVDTKTVASLAESMGSIGLLNPVSVRKIDGGHELCAGHHRLEAAKTLGWEDIAAVVVAFDDLDAELVMIDENLCRAELSPSDRAHYTARRKAIYLERHPETGHGANLVPGVAKSATPTNTASFAEETAKKTGESERVVRLHAERGEKVASDVLRKVKGTHLDNGVYLDALKKLSHDDQRTKVELDLTSERKRRARQKRKIVSVTTPEQLSDDDAEEKQFSALMNAWNKASPSVRQRFREEIDTPIMDAGQSDDIPSFLIRAHQ